MHVVHWRLFALLAALVAVALGGACALLSGAYACAANVNCPGDHVCTEGICTPPGGEGEGEGDSGEGEGEVPGAPTVTITGPVDGAFHRTGDSATFRCTAVDDEDGAVPNGSIEWTSNLDGALGVGAVVTNALVALGAHEIVCGARDSDGNVGTDVITVTVVDQSPPVATVLQPADGASFDSDATITFSGTASDAEDGTIGNVNLRWLDGGSQFGAGAAITTALPVGEHVITFAATDSDGAVGTATITIGVVD